MVRLWKALPLTLALVALSIATSSCSSGGTAQMRVINAIPDASSALDVEFNTSKVNSSPIAFDSVYPPAATPANYFGVSTGADTIEVLLTGTTKNPIIESSSEKLDGRGLLHRGSGWIREFARGRLPDLRQQPGADLGDGEISRHQRVGRLDRTIRQRV